MSNSLPVLYDYYDYRQFLREWYQAKKALNRHVTYRYIAMKTEIDAGYLAKVFQGQKHLSTEKLEGFVKLLDLSKREEEYFELLIHFGKAKSEERIRSYFEKLLSFTEVKSHTVDADRYEFYQHWYYTAVRELVNCSQVDDDYHYLATQLQPPIRVSEAKKSLELLKRLGFITIGEDGYYKLENQFITTGESWSSIAIRSFHREVISLAEKSVSTISPEERDLSCLTVTLSDTGLDILREKIKTFRSEIFDLCRQEKEVNRVYQINFQLFPMSKRQEKR